MLPKAIKYNNEIYNKVGMIKMNEGSFLVAENNNRLISVDLAGIVNIISNPGFEIKKPTQIEHAFIYFIQEKIQEQIYSNKISKENLEQVFENLDRYISLNLNVLPSLKLYNIDGNTTKDSLYSFFGELMKDNEYFKEPKENYPEYNEQVVTAILTQKQTNIDIDRFVSQYLYNFNLEQIDLLLTNFKLNDIYVQKLNNRKNELSVNTNNANSKANLGKRKTFSLPGIKENKEAAFIDTLLLSFTVGTLCGIYLMYFILTIMS